MRPIFTTVFAAGVLALACGQVPGHTEAQGTADGQPVRQG